MKNGRDTQQADRVASLSRRGLFAGIAGCVGCVRAAVCDSEACASEATAQAEHTWTEKADLTWEQIFRFAYQKDLIPVLKVMSEQIGREKFVEMLKEAGGAVVQKKTAGRPPVVRDLVTFAANAKNMPPLMQHALDVEMVEQTPEAFEYCVKKCLWAKACRDENAADIGYAMICYPDYAVAKGLNPKLILVRTKTLMQGDDSCRLRYVMEG